jgi:hypothetical protein
MSFAGDGSDGFRQLNQDLAMFFKHLGAPVSQGSSETSRSLFGCPSAATAEEALDEAA